MESMGVASRYGCKEVHVYRFPHITYPYSSCIFFLQQHPYILFILKYIYIYHYIGRILHSSMVSVGLAQACPNCYTAGIYMVQPKICDHYSGLII